MYIYMSIYITHTYHIYISSAMVPGSPWRNIPLLPDERSGHSKADPGVINQA